jgi:hypothetical protein
VNPKEPEQIMNLVLLLLGLSAVGLVGCATPPLPASGPRPASSSPQEELVTQRAVLTVRGRQFALNGYLAESAMGARRLIVTEMFGHVLADILVKRDGTAQVMRSSKLLRPGWIERYVAADMQCVFGGDQDAACPVQKLTATHFVIERRWYKLDLQIVDTKFGPQPAELFDETRREVP